MRQTWLSHTGYVPSPWVTVTDTACARLPARCPRSLDRIAIITSTRAALWSDNPDLIYALPFLFARVGITAIIVASADALLDSVHRRHVKILILDCSAVTDAFDRCQLVLPHTQLPIYICHPDEELVRDLRPLARGPLYWLPPSWVGVRLFDALRAQRAARAQEHALPDPPLTRREREVCALILAGKNNSDIARTLDISVETVKDHVHTLIAKYGVANRAAFLVAYNARR